MFIDSCNTCMLKGVRGQEKLSSDCFFNFVRWKYITLEVKVYEIICSQMTLNFTKFVLNKHF
jgi:hypothetical protein